MAANTTSMYNFKEIACVPDHKSFVDIVMSRTQRKTPTVVHPQFKISRIRNFYMRKVKYAQTTFNEKFSKILGQFPKIDDIHPFYADFFNVLYDRDHYKLALGQINAVRGIIDNIGKDYVKLLKFADTPYKCKMLKRAGLGRMCTAIKKCNSSLSYLEEVRQHLGRLPSINPGTRTLLIAGYPNVGKSSFMNIVSQADVDVQPYSFTTKSLFVGHFDFEYCRWQVIDTPGILDHELEARNTIEMTAITALAHIQSTILFFVDISEECGWTIEKQVQLFHNIKPLFKGKPLVVVLNKTDITKPDDLTKEQWKLLESMKEDVDVTAMLPTSCATKDGIDEVKKQACEVLLQRRVENKVKAGKVESLESRIFVTKMQQRADRPSIVPESVLKKRQAAEDNEDDIDMDGEEQPRRKLEIQLQEEGGGAGVHQFDHRKHFQLKNDEWKYDVIPEIMDGYNVADFIDPEIEAKLIELEKEEELLMKAAEPTAEDMEEEETWKHNRDELNKLGRKKRFWREHHALNMKKQHTPKPKMRHDVNTLMEKLAERGTSLKSIEKVMSRAKTVKRKIKSRTPGSAKLQQVDDDDMDMDDAEVGDSSKRGRSSARSASTRDASVRGDAFADVRAPRREESLSKGKKRRAESLLRTKPELIAGRASSRSKSMGHSNVNRTQQGLSKVEDRVVAEKKRRKVMGRLAKQSKKGPDDRHVPDLMPKHLFSGKLGRGKRDRR